MNLVSSDYRLREMYRELLRAKVLTSKLASDILYAIAPPSVWTDDLRSVQCMLDNVIDANYMTQRHDF